MAVSKMSSAVSKMSSAMIFWCCIINVAAQDDTNRESSTSTKMITGMAAGFGFIIGLTILVVSVWWCCCGNGCSGGGNAKRRVSPFESNTEPNTRSTSAESSRS